MHPARRSVATLHLLASDDTQGWLRCGPLLLRCAIGPHGLAALKREGDGYTPRGQFALSHLYYRADRVARPRTSLPVTPLSPDLGWCDSAGDRNYNRAVSVPYPASHERLWRDDHLYDVVVVLSHNRRPRVRGLGSCIFMHHARADYAPTAGCLALNRTDLAHLLAFSPRTVRIGLR